MFDKLQYQNSKIHIFKSVYGEDSAKMYDPKLPEEPNSNQLITKDENAEPINILEQAKTENLSVKNVALHQQQLQRLFFWLIGIGLGLGVILSIIVVFALDKFGLTKKPYERDSQPNKEQIYNQKVQTFEVQKQ